MWLFTTTVKLDAATLHPDITPLLDRKTREQPSEWKREGTLNKYMRLPDGSPPLHCKEEVLGVVGHGGLGQRIAGLGRALGMEVLVAARKKSSLRGTGSTPSLGSDRVPFDHVLERDCRKLGEGKGDQCYCVSSLPTFLSQLGRKSQSPNTSQPEQRTTFAIQECTTAFH